MQPEKRRYAVKDDGPLSILFRAHRFGAEFCSHCGRWFADQLIAMASHADASVREAAVNNLVFVDRTRESVAAVAQRSMTRFRMFGVPPGLRCLPSVTRQSTSFLP